MKKLILLTCMVAALALPAAAGSVTLTNEIIIDNGDAAAFKSEGGWASATGGHDYKDEVVWVASTGATETPAKATWTPDLKVAGQYDVYEWHGDDPNSDHASNAPFTVTFDGGTKTVLVNLRTNTGKWNLLGTFKFAAGKSGNVTLTSKADGNVIADAVKFVPSAAPALAAAEIIIDNGDTASFKSEGGWASATGGHDYKDEVVWVASTGATETPAKATWTPDIKVAGQYDVYEWHGDDPNTDHASNAPFTVTYDGGTKTILVNLRANTGKWNLLGTFKFAAGKSGNVTLTSKADGNVIADAVKFTPSAAPALATAAEIIIDNGDTASFKSEGGWASATGGHDYKDEVVWVASTGATETPAKATWTPDIKVAGQYDVYEWHGDDPNTDHASNAPFTVTYDGGTKTILVNLRANTGKWNLLGTFKFAAGKSGNVTLTSKADGNVIADAVKFTPHP